MTSSGTLETTMVEYFSCSAILAIMAAFWASATMPGRGVFCTRMDRMTSCRGCRDWSSR